MDTKGFFMLIFQYDDDNINCSTHKINAVDVKQRTLGDDSSLLITAYAGSKTIELAVWSDTRATARQAVDRITQAIEHDIYISPYFERDYLFLNTSKEPDDNQMQVSGRIIKSAFQN